MRGQPALQDLQRKLELPVEPVELMTGHQISASSSLAVVVQRAWRRWASDTGDRAQIFVDGPQVMIR